MRTTPVKTTLQSAPLSPAFAAFLAQAASQNSPPLESLPPVIVRQIYRDQDAALNLPAPAIGTVRDRTIEGPGGSSLPLRIYEPASTGPWPVLMFVHGGGFVMGDLQTHDKACRSLCHLGNLLVVAVDYRLAPEHPFPAAPDDVEAALRWLTLNAGDLGGDASRIAVAGDSAGAQLALVAVRRVRSPAVRALGLIYPVAQHPNEFSPSYEENDGKLLSRAGMQWFNACYLGGPSPTSPEHPDVAILKSDLSTLPATWIATMGHDPLRDEGHALALRAEAAGVKVCHRHDASAIHACIHFSAVSPAGPQLLADLAQWLNNQL